MINPLRAGFRQIPEWIPDILDNFAFLSKIGMIQLNSKCILSAFNAVKTKRCECSSKTCLGRVQAINNEKIFSLKRHCHKRRFFRRIIILTETQTSKIRTKDSSVFQGLKERTPNELSYNRMEPPQTIRRYFSQSPNHLLCIQLVSVKS